MLYLTQDIVSAFGTIKAKKGTPVEIHTEHGDVYIVTDTDGNRFPCRKEFLTDQQPKKDETEPSKPNPISEPASIPGGKKTKTKKAAPPAQPGLFG